MGNGDVPFGMTGRNICYTKGHILLWEKIYLRK